MAGHAGGRVEVEAAVALVGLVQADDGLAVREGLLDLEADEGPLEDALRHEEHEDLGAPV